MSRQFSEGQSVFLIYKNSEDKFNVNEDMLVVNRASVDEEGPHYSLMLADDSCMDWCRPEDMFTSEKNAQEECTKRNAVETLNFSTK